MGKGYLSSKPNGRNPIRGYDDNGIQRCTSVLGRLAKIRLGPVAVTPTGRCPTCAGRGAPPPAERFCWEPPLSTTWSITTNAGRNRRGAPSHTENLQSPTFSSDSGTWAFGRLWWAPLSWMRQIRKIPTSTEKRPQKAGHSIPANLPLQDNPHLSMLPTFI